MPKDSFWTDKKLDSNMRAYERADTNYLQLIWADI